MPEATIVLTVFNEAPYVGEMIDSVLSSSVKKCYIVDNNSSDGTQEIIHSKSDNEIMHVYYLDEQRALFDNLSFLASMVEDKYIYILGGDDLLVKEGFDSVIDESNVGGYLIPRVHYFSDKSGCIVEEYPVKNWVDSCNTAKTSYQLIYAQLMYASNDVHILGLHDKNNFLRIYSSCKVNCLEGPGFWYTLGALLIAKNEKKVVVSDAVGMCKRVDLRERTGILSSESLHNVPKKNVLEKFVNRIWCIYGSIYNSFTFYRMYGLSSSCLFLLLLFPRTNGDTQKMFCYGPVIEPIRYLWVYIRKYLKV